MQAIVQTPPPDAASYPLAPMNDAGRRWVINMAEFGASSNAGGDTTPAICAALEACRARGGAGTIIFPPGRYDFRSDRAPEAFLFISNNDEGLRRIAFLINDLSDVVIDGQGSEFLFHDVIIPFVIENSRRVTLKNLTVDWENTFHCEGVVISSDDSGVELEIPPSFPYQVVNGRFQCLGTSRKGWSLSNMLEFDAVRRETAYAAQDNYEAADKFVVEEIGPRRVRFTGKFSEPRPTPGNIMLLADDRRMCPAVFISDSSEIALEEVSIFHAGAMGVIAQRSADLKLTRLKVMPRPEGGRIISTTADATHFVSCRGKIELSDCVFENQVDDAANVHGIYTKITGRPDSCSVEVRLVHTQQTGRHPAEVGHSMQFVSRDSLLPIYEAKVSSLCRINREYTVLTFAQPLPECVEKGCAALDLYWQPAETIIRRCTLSGNRARGILISVGGRVLIEDCKFHVPGAAVLIEGDANYWFESGPVSDVTIRNSSFANCNFGPWGTAAIQVSPGIESPSSHSERYHRNIRVENNHFEAFFPTLLDVKSVEGLRFKGNTFAPSASYPARHAGGEKFNIVACSEVEVESPKNSATLGRGSEPSGE